ncbi:fibroblast growth factor receptor 4-like, partial [Cydia fagiglandana]|uniref:fibroblast growth factor receptor 4-like n=1 Tax=Cydia fagiglandana TaxID=1458189 RepID=UPI002FEE4867
YGRWSILFEEVTRTDNGNYTCLVCNELGCISNTFVLTVVDRYPSRPYIKDGYPGNITAMVNDTIQFSCPTTTDLEPYLYWVKVYDNFTITDKGLLQPTIPGFEIKSDNPADDLGTLTVANVTLSDRGWYGCVAMNSLGTATAMGYLTVLEKVCKCAD